MNELIDIKEKLKDYEEKYPNIISIWKDVISSRINLINCTIAECNNVIQLIETNEISEDMEKTQILFLYLLKISNFFNTT
tara:strand:+ start:1393 stop:1632 length:240 start_codon:yes stop_codon:yes gene_type:complete